MDIAYRSDIMINWIQFGGFSMMCGSIVSLMRLNYTFYTRVVRPILNSEATKRNVCLYVRLQHIVATWSEILAFQPCNLLDACPKHIRLND